MPTPKKIVAVTGSPEDPALRYIMRRVTASAEEASRILAAMSGAKCRMGQGVPRGADAELFIPLSAGGDFSGPVIGTHRIALNLDGGKATIDTPKRSEGSVRGAPLIMRQTKADAPWTIVEGVEKGWAAWLSGYNTIVTFGVDNGELACAAITKGVRVVLCADRSKADPGSDAAALLAGVRTTLAELARRKADIRFCLTPRESGCIDIDAYLVSFGREKTRALLDGAGFPPSLSNIDEDPKPLVPIRLISPIQAAELPPMKLLGWLYSGVVHLVAGDGGAGKSAIFLSIACHLATGRSVLNVAKRNPLRVVIWSAEDPQRVCETRTAAIVSRWEKDEQKLVAANLSIFPAETLEARVALVDVDDRRRPVATSAWLEFSAKMHVLKPDVIVIDNASDVFCADENSRRDVRFFMARLLGRLARELDAAIILLAHVNKASAVGKNGGGYSGSTAWSNSARVRMLLEKAEGDDRQCAPEGTTRLLRMEKCNYGPAGFAYGFAIEDGAPRGTGEIKAPDQATARRRLDSDVLAAVIDLHDRNERMSPKPQANTWLGKLAPSLGRYKAKEIESSIRRLVASEQLKQVERKGSNRRLTFNVEPATPHAHTVDREVKQ